MNFSSIAPVRVLAVVGAACGLAALAGCQGEKNVAHIGSAAITEKVFNDRTQHIMQADMLPIADAGGSTLTHMILEEAANQVAKEKGYEPSAAAVTASTAYQIRVDPNKRRAIEQGVITAADFEPSARYNMETFAIGTEGAKPKPEDVQKLYDNLKTVPAQTPANPMTGQPAQNNPIKIPAELTFRVVGAKDEATATKILAQLKTNDDFKAAAQTAGLPGQDAEAAGQEAPFPEQYKQTLPEVYAAMTQTPAGQYVSKPIPVPNAKKPQQYLVAKIVKNTPEVLLTLEEARPLLERAVVSNDKKDWFIHQTTVLNERLRKILSDGSIQINIPRYQSITTKVIPLLMEDAEKTARQQAAQIKQQAAMEALRAQQPPPGTPNPNAPQTGGKPTVRPVQPAPKANSKP